MVPKKIAGGHRITSLNSKDSPKLKIKDKKVDKKCWHFENGFCKKGSSCNWLHPSEICRYYSKYGQCPQGLVCSLRHPLRICMSYMEGGCHMGDMCVLQHPINNSPPRHSYSSPPHSSFLDHSHSRANIGQNITPTLPYPPQSYQFSPATNIQTLPKVPQPPRQPFVNPGVFSSGRLQAPPQPQPTYAQTVQGYPHNGAPSSSSLPGNPNAPHDQNQQGFW